MKTKIILIICLSILTGIAQVKAQYMRTRGNSNVGASFFGSDSGQGLRVDYNNYLNSSLVINPALFYEWGNPMQSSYNQIGADVMFGVIPFDMGQKLALFLKAGVTGGYEKLTGLKNDINGFSVGGKGGAELEYAVSESLSFSAYGYQSYMLKKVFGRSYYHIGVGVKFNMFRY